MLKMLAKDMKYGDAISLKILIKVYKLLKEIDGKPVWKTTFVMESSFDNSIVDLS